MRRFLSARAIPAEDLLCVPAPLVAQSGFQSGSDHVWCLHACNEEGGAVPVEGKTKVIQKTSTPGEVLLITKDSLTGGDAAKKETIQGIAVHKTTQTTNVFRLLSDNGIPTAFLRRADETTIVCHECHMLPLELVTRRFAWGSFLKREPQLVSTVEKPHRFDQVKAELYHKHAVVMPPLVDSPVQMDEGEARELYLKDGQWAAGVYTDPLIIPRGNTWRLHSAKDPVDPQGGLMDIEPTLPAAEAEQLVRDIMIPVFELLEKTWATIETIDGPIALVDMKIEVGRRVSDGALVVADVIDNDSWRIWPGGNPAKQLDKQCFREGHPLNEVSEKYALVASLTEQFHQA
jgi:phosphoribosylaminoimidazole-succinocarboxamide synthase